ERGPENIPLLVNHFLKRLEEQGLPFKSFSREALSALTRHDWPGNVRELEHLVEQVVMTTPGHEITLDDLPPQVLVHLPEPHETPFSLDFDLERPLPEITEELTERAEKAYLTRVLETYNGRIDRSAEHCGLSRRSISEKLRRYNIDKAQFKPSARQGLAVGD
ncbi:MAG TPA: helix-turn-helix domain-containing protein, partial [Isosphaeraceae bacterium]|nr:helix-turn-helix domain-containing protein [Isosphaeraceae bacterium]